MIEFIQFRQEFLRENALSHKLYVRDFENLLRELSVPPKGPEEQVALRAFPQVDDREILFIARRGDHGWQAPIIVGMVTLIPVYPISGSYGLIEDVVVHPSYRRQGIAERLMHDAFAHARELGLPSVELTSRAVREAANKLYDKLGFTDRPTRPRTIDL